MQHPSRHEHDSGTSAAPGIWHRACRLRRQLRLLPARQKQIPADAFDTIPYWARLARADGTDREALYDAEDDLRRLVRDWGRVLIAPDLARQQIVLHVLARAPFFAGYAGLDRVAPGRMQSTGEPRRARLAHGFGVDVPTPAAILARAPSANAEQASS